MADSSALVLGGGAVKGAFQVGALKYVLGEYGFRPSIIYGTSVGALNGAFLADRAGRVPENEEPNWKQIGEELCRFWEQKITKPSDILRRRWALGIAWDIVRRKFRGIVNPSPLHELVRQEINPKNLRRVQYSAGTVDVDTGAILYTDMITKEEQERLIEYIIASTSIPIAMPIKHIERKLFYDGCLIDVAPLNKAIRAGASQIITIACQSERVANPDQVFHSTDLGRLFERVSDILTNEILANDLKFVERVNTMVRKGTLPQELSRYREVWSKVIRPEKFLDVDMLKFESTDIKRLMELGYASAKKALERQPVSS